MKTKIRKWDTSEHLTTPEIIKGYLELSLERSTEDFMVAIGNVAKSKGMTEIAKKTGLSRQNLYKALTADKKPQFDTVNKVIEAFGIKLVLETKDKKVDKNV